MNNPQWLELFIEDEVLLLSERISMNALAVTFGTSTRSKTFGIRPTKKLFDFLARDVPPAACQSPRATY